MVFPSTYADLFHITSYNHENIKYALRIDLDRNGLLELLNQADENGRKLPQTRQTLRILPEEQVIEHN